MQHIKYSQEQHPDQQAVTTSQPNGNAFQEYQKQSQNKFVSPSMYGKHQHSNFHSHNINELKVIHKQNSQTSDLQQDVAQMIQGSAKSNKSVNTRGSVTLDLKNNNKPPLSTQNCEIQQDNYLPTISSQGAKVKMIGEDEPNLAISSYIPGNPLGIQKQIISSNKASKLRHSMIQQSPKGGVTDVIEASPIPNHQFVGRSSSGGKFESKQSAQAKAQ